MINNIGDNKDNFSPILFGMSFLKINALVVIKGDYSCISATSFGCGVGMHNDS